MPLVPALVACLLGIYPFAFELSSWVMCFIIPVPLSFLSSVASMVRSTII